MVRLERAGRRLQRVKARRATVRRVKEDSRRSQLKVGADKDKDKGEREARAVHECRRE